MMREGDGLGGLEMGEAGHDGLDMPCRLRDERALQRREPLARPCAGFAHPEPEIRRHLVVARARGVQPAGRLSHDLREPCLDVEMNVLELALEDETARFDLLFDGVET